MGHINLGYLKAIAQGDNEFILNTVNSLIRELEDACIKMELYLVDNRMADLAVLAHSMKFGIDLMGIKALADSLKLIEDCQTSKTDVRVIKGIIEKITELSIEVIEELETEKRILEYNIQHNIN